MQFSKIEIDQLTIDFIVKQWLLNLSIEKVVEIAMGYGIVRIRNILMCPFDVFDLSNKEIAVEKLNEIFQLVGHSIITEYDEFIELKKQWKDSMFDELGIIEYSVSTNGIVESVYIVK